MGVHWFFKLFYSYEIDLKDTGLEEKLDYYYLFEFLTKNEFISFVGVLTGTLLNLCDELTDRIGDN